MTSARRVRFALILVYIASFALSLVSIFVSFAMGHIYQDDLKTLILKLLAVYSVPLGTIAGGLVGRRGRQASLQPSAGLFALVLGSLWSLLIVGRCIVFIVAPDESDSVSDLLDYLGPVSSGGAFLVSASLSNFFAAAGGRAADTGKEGGG
jgi:hypothetical protein